jgi:hypothetical protein
MIDEYAMSIQEQWDWIDKRKFDNPFWAETESNIRQLAVQIQQNLDSKENRGLVEAMVSVPSPKGTFGMTAVRVQFTITRFGGLEERLLIEEQLRRAMRGPQ